MIKEKLREFGFSEKEANVYLALLEAGSAVASDIAKKAGIKRSTAYVVLDSLTERNLVHTTARRGIQVYQAAPPKQLVEHLRGMADHYAKLADAAKEVLHELPSPSAASVSAPKIRFFEGTKGINTVYEDTLASLEEIRVHAAFTHGEDVSAGSAAVPALERTTNIKMQVVFPEHSGKKKQSASDRDTLRRALFASRGESNFSSEINVYDDRVVLISTAEDFALTIESRELADAMRKTLGASAEEERDVKKLILHPAFAS